MRVGCVLNSKLGLCQTSGAFSVERVVDALGFLAPLHRLVAAVIIHQRCISRAISIFDGAFSSRDMVGCEHKGSPLSGAWPTAILKIGSYRSESQSSASS